MVNLRGMTYQQLVKAYNNNSVGWDDIKSEYKKIRNSAMRQIQRISKSDVAFIDENSRPKFAPPSELKTLSDYLHELADINRFVSSPYYSLKDRRQIRDRTIETLRSRGWNVTKENYTQYIAFLRWYQAHADTLIYDSDDEKMRAFFNQNYSRSNMHLASRWQRVFRDAQKSGVIVGEAYDL